MSLRFRYVFRYCKSGLDRDKLEWIEDDYAEDIEDEVTNRNCQRRFGPEAQCCEECGDRGTDIRPESIGENLFNS